MSEKTHLVAILVALGTTLPANAAENPPPAHLPSRDMGMAPPMRIPNAELVAPLSVGTPVDIVAVPAAVRRAVVVDAAKRFGVTQSSVVLTDAEQVTWSDGSLGCAQPGGVYTQNLVAGYRIVAKTGAGILIYHTDTRGLVVSCGAQRLRHTNKISEKTPVGGAAPRTQPPTSPPDR